MSFKGRRRRAEIKVLAALARVSVKARVRRLSPLQRAILASTVKLGAFSNEGRIHRVVLQAVRGVLFAPKIASQQPLFDPEFVRSTLNASPELSDKELFWKWIVEDARSPTTPFFSEEPAFGEETVVHKVSGESPFQTFLLEGLWDKQEPWPGFDPDVTRPFVKQLRKQKIIGHRISYLGVMQLLFPRGRIRLPEPEFLTYYRHLSRMKGVSLEELLLVEGERKKMVAQRLRNGVLGEMVRKATDFDPLIMHPAHMPRRFVMPPFVSAGYRTIIGLDQVFGEIGRRRYENVVVIPHCRMSGAARVAGELSFALAQIFGADNLLIIRTDLSDFEHPEWFPKGVPAIDVSAWVSQMVAINKVRFLFNVLRAVGAKRVFNVNSGLMWATIRQLGNNLADSASLYAYLFCSDRNALGAEAGYPVDYFYPSFDALTGIFTDSRFLASSLEERFLLKEYGPEKLAVLPTPTRDVPENIPAREEGKARPQVFWGGRMDKQKRFGLVVELASRMPDVDFRVWGKPVLDNGTDFSALPKNISLEGEYASFAKLPLSQCDAWLYTSYWDGVPTILLDVVGYGLPLVASAAGGVCDLLDERFCHSIPVEMGVEAYERALREVLADPASARMKALALRDEMLTERRPDHFVKCLARALGVEKDAACQMLV